MKYNQSIVWIMLSALFTFTACEKDPFNGTDNYMLEFALQTAEGETFNGDISDHLIQINIPSNRETDQLTAKYTVSEMATVSPNPETVKDWSSEQTFTVTSYNGTPRPYTVKVMKTDVIMSESVYLRTDEDVAAFAAKEINIVNGNLIIGAPAGTDSISNIDALTGLKEVRYQIIINTTYKGIDLNGLRNLQKAGSLSIQGTFKQLTKIELPALENIQSVLSISSEEITDILLPQFNTAGNIRFILPKLEQLNLEQLTSTKEVNIRSANRLKTIHLPSLVKANLLHIEKCNTLESIQLPSLMNVEETLRIVHNSSLTDLSCINKIENAQRIEISSCPQLTSLKPVFGMLKTLGDLSVSDLPQIKDELDLSHVSIHGSVRIIRCLHVSAILLPEKIGDTFELNLASDESQTVLPHITGVAECQNFQISNAPGIKEMVLPSSLKKIAKRLYLNGGILSVSGENLQEAGDIRISSNNLASISFPNLTKVTDKLSLFGKYLETIRLSKLTSVGELEIGGSYSGWQNEKLTNLDFLSSLTSVETLEIKFCKFLTDYSGLTKAVESGSITEKNWHAGSVHDNAYNPTYEDLKAGRYVKP